MSFFRHWEIFRSDGMPSVRSHELTNQIARPDSNAKNPALRTRYKRSASMPDTLGYSRKTPQLSATAISYTRERPIHRPLAHRLDEFPVGYSSASCTPAALASASPTGSYSAIQVRRRPSIFQPTANSVLTFCVTRGDKRTSAASAKKRQVVLHKSIETKAGISGNSQTSASSCTRIETFCWNWPLVESGTPAEAHTEPLTFEAAAGSRTGY
jgi:hypothetical protein